MMKPNVCSCVSSFSSVQAESCSDCGIGAAARRTARAADRAAAIDVGRRRAARERERDVVEAALHVERRRQRAAAHPEDAEPPLVRERSRPAGSRRRTRATSATPTMVSQRRRPLMTAADAIARVEAVRLAEHLARQHLVGSRRIEPAAAPQVHVVQRRPPSLGQRDRAGRSPARPGRARRASRRRRRGSTTARRRGSPRCRASRLAGARLSDANTSANRAPLVVGRRASAAASRSSTGT